MSEPKSKDVVLLCNPQAGGRWRVLADILDSEEAKDVRRIVTDELDDVKDAIAGLGQRVKLLAIYGGDGTVFRVIAEMLRRPDHVHPRLALLAGGTMNVTAAWCGMSRSPARNFRGLMEAYHGDRLLWREVPLVAITHDGETQYGFTWGIGPLVRILHRYEQGPKGHASALGIAARSIVAAVSSFPRDFQPILQELTARITVDGKELPHTRYAAVFANVTGVINPFVAPFVDDRSPDSFHFLAYAVSSREFALVAPLLARARLPIDPRSLLQPVSTWRQLFLSLAGKGTLPLDPRYINQAAHEVIVTTDEKHYTIDGEVFPLTTGRLEVRLGPSVRLATLPSLAEALDEAAASGPSGRDAPTDDPANPGSPMISALPESPLTAELEAAVARALAREWAMINYSQFRRALRPPTFLLADVTTRLGQWSPRDRTIEIARRLVLDHPWSAVIEVLKHEMAHQYVHEVLGATDETSHGAAFRRVCATLAIDAAASGLPRVPGPLEGGEARVLHRIAKLLALAESPNRHEAESAMNEAQRLMLKYNVDEVATDRRSGYHFRHLGEPTGRLQAHQRLLASILGSHFFVETIWVTVHRPLLGTSGTVLEVCGTPANLEMASYVHDFLLQTAERLWRDHQRATGLRANALRRSYLAGVMRGFDQKLGQQQEESRREGLVWVADAGLAAYFDARYPRRRSLRTAARAHPGAFAAGQQAGRSIVLHKPVGTASSGGGRALPPRRG